MTLPYAVDFRGFTACPCLAEWLPVFEAELKRRGIIPGALHIYQLIGSNPSSGGTHATGGAFDVFYYGALVVLVAREMGADATWHRPYGWDGAHGIEHVHGVLRGCPHNEAASYQITAVDAGFDGLGHLGEGGPDTGPRPLSQRTWQQGIDWAHEQEDDMPYTEDQLTAIIRAAVKAEVHAALDAETVDKAGQVTVRQSLNQTRNAAVKAAAK